MCVNAERYAASTLHSYQYSPFSFNSNSSRLIIELVEKFDKFTIISTNLYRKRTLSWGRNEILRWKNRRDFLSQAESVQTCTGYNGCINLAA